MYQVMLVDDYEIFRKKIKRLQVWKKFPQFQITAEAENGEQALDLLKQNSVQIVITDIRMPVMDGIELLKEIQDQKLADCVILLSEYTEFEYARQGIVLGAFDYLLKPVEEEKIEQVLNRVCQHLQKEKEDNFSWWEKELAVFCIKESKEAWEEKIKGFLDEIQRKSKGQYRRMGECLANSYAVILDEIKEQFSWMISVAADANQIGIALEEEKEEGGQRRIFTESLVKLKIQIQSFCYVGKSELVAKVCEFVLNHPKEKCSLADISERFFVNKAYLSHQFKQETGRGLMNYIAEFKVECAKKMLVETQMLLWEIAEHLGYENARYFGQIFHTMTGSTMAEYRKEKTLR